MTPKPPACPICKHAQTPDYRPFCSRRCADIDLGRWLTGGYVVPTDEVADDGMADPEDDGPMTRPN